MSDNSKKINPETQTPAANPETSPEKSFFSTMMKGTPNLLDLIDPGKVSDSVFSTHKQTKNEKDSPEANQENKNNTLISNTIKEEVSSENKIIEENNDPTPALPLLPKDLPLPKIEEETSTPIQPLFESKKEDISTLYIKNLNEKINLTDLKYSLNFLFSQFGTVIAIQLSKKNKLRGQAFLTFSTPGDARRALKTLQGTLFFEKDLKIELAKTRSLASFIHEGKFHNLSERIHALRKSKVGIKTMLKDTEPAEARILMKTASHMLSVENFPDDLTPERFKLLFRQFPGFKSARLIKKRKVGLVEFYDKAQAMIAMKKYEGFMMDDQHLLKVRFAKADL